MKKHKVPMTSDGKILVLDSIAATRIKMPKYNAWQCRGGVHGDTKYNRTKSKREFKKLIDKGLY